MKPRSTITYIGNNQKTIMKPTSESSRDIKKNLIRDFPLIVDDAKRYMNMYNREIAKLKGNKTRSKSSKIQDMVVIPLPLTLVKKHNTESL